MIDYQVDEKTTILLFIKVSQNMFSNELSQYVKKSMSFNVSEVPDLLVKYRTIWNEVESQLYEKITTEPLKKKGKYTHSKLKLWKERIRTNVHVQYVPYNIYWSTTAVIKIDSVCKQSKNSSSGICCRV